jgi:hypothetical protein
MLSKLGGVSCEYPSPEFEMYSQKVVQKVVHAVIHVVVHIVVAPVWMRGQMRVRCKFAPR